MRVKPLKELLDRADVFLKTASSETAISKEASTNSEASVLAGLLAQTEAGVELEFDSELIKQAEVDRIAESLNRVQTASEIETAVKLAEFQNKAKDEGFTDEQISEAVSKIAATKMAKSIPLWAAMGFVGKGEDKNSLPAKPENKPTQAQLLKQVNLTKGMGY